MDPNLAISMIENDIRFIIRQHQPVSDEAKWISSVLGAAILEDIELRRSGEVGRRRPVRVPDSLLAYTTLAELRKCLNAISWSLLAESLGRKKEFDVLLDQVDRYRNTVAHSRELLQHEAAFLEGVAGIIRTRVTIQRSTMDTDRQHYPVIEYLRDSLGNEAKDLNPTLAISFVSTGIRLRVGDIVTFSCRGWDAQGRELSWSIGRSLKKPRSTVTGSEVELEWTISDADVGVGTQVGISLRSSGKYHRHAGNDQLVLFTYAVDPPTE